MKFEELAEIKNQIEATKSKNGLSVGEKEFVWLYEPGKPLEMLKEYHGIAWLLGGGFGGDAVEYQRPKSKTALAFVHNHRSGPVAPSYDDLRSFLSMVPKNPKLDYSIIASTPQSIVGGYYVMHYQGQRHEAKMLKRKIGRIYEQRCNSRQEEINKHPEIFNVKVGENIFSLNELIDLSLELMKIAQIDGELVAMPGYEVKFLRFIKI